MFDCSTLSGPHALDVLVGRDVTQERERELGIDQRVVHERRPAVGVDVAEDRAALAFEESLGLLERAQTRPAPGNVAVVPSANVGVDEQPREHRPLVAQHLELRRLDGDELEVGRAVPPLPRQEVGQQRQRCLRR